MNKILKQGVAFIFTLTVLLAPMLATAQFKPSEKMGARAEELGLVKNNDITSVIVNIIKWLLLVMIFLAVAAFAVAGVIYITAGGAGKADLAKSVIINAIVGVIVGLIGYVVVLTVDNLLKGKDVTIGQ